MDKQFKKRLVWGALPALVIMVLGVAAIFFWKADIPEPPVAVEEIKELKKEDPAKLPKVVLRSRLAEAGWYTADANALNKQIEGFFQKAQVKPINNVIALILPHAGYAYSGQSAVTGLKTTVKKYKRIVVIGPSHRVPMEEMLSVPRVTHYETPLGQIPLDVEFINKLLKYSLFQNVPRAHESEHSVQIELPLLQYSRKDFELVPIVAGSCSLETITRAGTILRSLADAETLLVASSDFVHYGRGHRYVPFTENIPENIKQVDMGAYEYIAGLDSKGFLEYRYKPGPTICGYIPIAILLSTLGGPVKADLINYVTSGELTGDFTNSVSYLSVAFSGAWQNRPKIEPQANDPELTDEDKKQLLALARKTIVYALRNRRVPQASELGVTISEAMRCPRAAFVTLKKNSQLRGCIGEKFPQRPLYKSVILNAINACVNDRRFPAVAEAECKDITIEISALTVPEPIASPDEIRIGIDGVVLNKSGRSRVFLPQVASEHGWDVNQMLTQLSLKAQLPPDAWKEGASFLVFQAVVFGEDE
ncbi:MAG: AmmeMemoRadiSam system protein B [Planctomycetota bacterium]|jgi:AmmeMemoRadiSam system protein B/AmmeMemoRadiSam system protein A